MKSEWNKSWNSSTQPWKQRKFRHNAPIQERRKLMASNLSKELRGKYKRRSFPVRIGDKVKVMRGQFKGKISAIDKVDVTKYKVYLTDVALKKEGGQAPIKYPLSPSNIQLITLNLDDKARIKALERTKK